MRELIRWGSLGLNAKPRRGKQKYPPRYSHISTELHRYWCSRWGSNARAFLFVSSVWHCSVCGDVSGHWIDYHSYKLILDMLNSADVVSDMKNEQHYRGGRSLLQLDGVCSSSTTLATQIYLEQNIATGRLAFPFPTSPLLISSHDWMKP